MTSNNEPQKDIYAVGEAIDRPRYGTTQPSQVVEKKTKGKKAACSFCRKSSQDVGPVVEGPGNVYICRECIDLCQSILEHGRQRRRDEQDSDDKQNEDVMKKIETLLHEAILKNLDTNGKIEEVLQLLREYRLPK